MTASTRCPTCGQPVDSASPADPWKLTQSETEWLVGALTPIEIRLWRVLWSGRGKWVKTEAVAKRVWVVCNRSKLSTTINRLRHKLAASPWEIETASAGSCYRLVRKEES